MGCSGIVDEVVLPVVGEVIGEAEQDAAAHAKKLLDELRAETDQKLNAQYDGFETGGHAIRDEDRARCLEMSARRYPRRRRVSTFVRESPGDGKGSNAIELALARDELLSVISEKKYAQFTDDAPKLELAEKAIASLRKRITSLEEERRAASRKGRSVRRHGRSGRHPRGRVSSIDQELADPLRRESLAAGRKPRAPMNWPTKSGARDGAGGADRRAARAQGDPLSGRGRPIAGSFRFQRSRHSLFPAALAAGFPYLPQAERRATPAVVRRLYTAAADTQEDADCLICEAPAPVKGRVLIAIETDGSQDIGCVCAACSAWGLGNAERADVQTAQAEDRTQHCVTSSGRRGDGAGD